MSSLERDLEQLGLSAKESKVYLASLELGPETVQEIAAKAGVNRATTYVMIESLIRHGLMSSFDKGKKSYFVAETPERMEHLIREEKEVIESKERNLAKILPELLARHAASERPRVRFYEGVEGLEAMREDLFRAKVTYVEDIISLDDYRQTIPEPARLAHAGKLAARKIGGRMLYTTASKPAELTSEVQKYWEVRRIPADKFPLSGEIVLYGNRVAMLSYKGKLLGVIIESKEIAETARSIFSLSWSCATVG